MNMNTNASAMFLDSNALKVHYRHTQEELSKKQGMLRNISRKAHEKIEDAAKLRCLNADLIERGTCIGLDAAIEAAGFSEEALV